MSRELPPMLEQAVRDGILTREKAEEVDAWAEDLAIRQTKGEVTDEEVDAITRAKAVGDAIKAGALDLVILVPGRGPEDES